MPRILFVGGGSVGHTAPCVAVWRTVQEGDPTAAAHFLCADRGDDADFLRREDLPFTRIPLPRISWKFPFRFCMAYLRSGTTIRQFHPDVIFSKGGALSVAPCLAAKQRGIPIVLHESDAVMGRANRLIARLASVVCLGFPGEKDLGHRTKDIGKSQHADSESHLSPKSQVPSPIVTGNPIRPAITHGSREEGLRLTGLSGTRPILLVMGGSQGAQAINEIVWKLLPTILELCDVMHITGRGKKVEDGRWKMEDGYWSCEFAHEELSHLYATATMALSRSGAGSIGELAANGIPSILVPLAGVAQDHQRANARAVEHVGGCILIEQEQLEKSLLPTIHDLCVQSKKREELASSIRSFHHADAASRIKDIILHVSQRRSLARGA